MDNSCIIRMAASIPSFPVFVHCHDPAIRQVICDSERCNAKIFHTVDEALAFIEEHELRDYHIEPVLEK